MASRPTKNSENGDVLNIDITVDINGYHGDTNKMFSSASGVLAKRLSKITQKCMYRGIEAVRPGARLGDDGLRFSHAEAQRFSVVREFCGHGIAKFFMTIPKCYGRPGTGQILEEGMCFTIEPMINAGKRNIKILPDQWTAVTKDHKLSASGAHAHGHPQTVAKSLPSAKKNSCKVSMGLASATTVRRKRLSEV